MFVEQSETRLRRVRIGFVLLCLVPTVGLVAWAFQRHSTAHRETMAAEVTRLLSTEVAFESLRHLQPGCLRLSGVRLGGASLGTVGVETTPTEVRLLLDQCECSPAFAGQLATLARRWRAGNWGRRRSSRAQCRRKSPLTAGRGKRVVGWSALISGK
jgi:hypothetical protein